MNYPTCTRSGPAQTALALCVHGAEVPTEGLIWQDPLPEDPDPTRSQADVAAPKDRIAASAFTFAHRIFTAWARASSFRGSDTRRVANGARNRLEPQCSWEVNVHVFAGTP